MQKPQETSEKECRHFWKIEAANDKTSLGKCKRCGKVEEFVNIFVPYNYKREISQDLSKNY